MLEAHKRIACSMRLRHNAPVSWGQARAVVADVFRWPPLRWDGDSARRLEERRTQNKAQHLRRRTVSSIGLKTGTVICYS